MKTKTLRYLLQSVRDKIDAADRTPFGDLEKHLDAMAVEADRALAELARLEAAEKAI